MRQYIKTIAVLLLAAVIGVLGSGCGPTKPKAKSLDEVYQICRGGDEIECHHYMKATLHNDVSLGQLDPKTIQDIADKRVWAKSKLDELEKARKDAVEKYAATLSPQDKNGIANTGGQN